jgi:hypothetical protein
VEAFAPFLQDLFHNFAEILIFLALAIVTAFLGRIKNWWKDRAVKQFERGINQNCRVRELLSELRVLCKADRAELWQLHNGEFYVSGTSIMKCSLTHYVTKTGIASPSPVQNIPTTHMLMTLKGLQDNTCSQYAHGTLADDSFQDAIFAATGNNIVVAAAVRDLRKNWIGIVCVAWIRELTLDPKSEIESYAQQIGELVSKKG